MTTYNEIRNVIITKLQSKYTNIPISGEEIPQEFDKPAIFVKLTSEPGKIVNLAHREKNLLIEICCYSNYAQPLLELWNVADELDNIFCPVLEVGNRAISISNPHSEMINSVLHYRFNLSFIDSLEENQIYGYQEHALMAELELKEEL